jgi:adenine-specific DNA-methyltransferase
LSAIHDLIAQVSDPRLRERLAAEWASASKEKKFGLVFEDHLPELLPLYKARPRRGDLVCRRDGSLKDVWQVQQVKDGMATCIKPGDAAQASPARATEHGVALEPVRWAVDELLVVRQFGEPIFPSLVPVDAVANGPGRCALAHADRGRQLPRVAAAGVSLRHAGGLHLHRPAVQQRRARLEIQQRLRG